MQKVTGLQSSNYLCRKKWYGKPVSTRVSECYKRVSHRIRSHTLYFIRFIHHQQDTKFCKWWLHVVIRAVKKTKFFILLMMNKSNEIRIRFSKYWMYWYIWVSLKSKFVFVTTKSSKTGHKSDNFSDIKKPVRILLDNLIKKSVQNFESIGWKLFHLCCQPIWKHGFEKKNRHSHHFEKNNKSL